MDIKSLTATIDRLRTEVPQFISADIVEIDSGMSVYGTSIDPNFDGAAASACYAEVVKANARALDLLGLGANATEDILITTAPAYLLIRMVGPRHYLGLAIARQGTLGFARTMMQRLAPALIETLSK